MGCTSSTTSEAIAPRLNQQNSEDVSVQNVYSSAIGQKSSGQVSGRPAAEALSLDDIALGDQELGVVMNPASEEMSAGQFEDGKDFHSMSDASGSEGKVKPPNKKAAKTHQAELLAYLDEVSAKPDAMKKQVVRKRKKALDVAKVADLIAGTSQVLPKAPGKAESPSDSCSLSQ
eukprot:TRINITY_DN13630_c0_g2_i3.p1 TRINITY_DN13630_c0_g2~~TRINITY_DN13630_c0_g2_i3.p1  ORF type:complete len:174 (-),score=41.78 TRINITY_DN13630_c0_g2_i3:31-552(-)